ncbi:uncharacterized protein E0L32_005475 [Thyridium curvatum]|uniref:NACHT domain-containing protein n=1 Tax=Thyridium curvatum TaxID=1093900 RepID=A0A507BC22_9PEZI|nr:uncharacterized protein E0L32_005475 [Thyridium curvatum]TPX14511.1 hypothetical protein E0L32_005475 [Thyridium curvatum]
MSASAVPGDSFRQRLRERVNRFRRKSNSSSKNAESSSRSRNPGSGDGSSNALAVTANYLAYRQNLDGPGQTTVAGGDVVEPEVEGETPIPLPPSLDLQVNVSVDGSNLDIAVEATKVPSDLWTAAYRDAVDSLGKDIDIAILKGHNVAELFKQLEKMDKDTTQESVFLRGVKYLQSLRVPLERFKLALDLASPLTSIEPTTATVFGVVKGVTALAISLSTADLELAKKIGEMLEQLAYIDDCDTLGQRTNKEDIHKALVLVYRKLLEFYNTAFEILTSSSVKLAMKMVLSDGRLPDIVSDFLRHADLLRKLVEKATWEIVEDVRAMLYDHEIASWLGNGKMSRQSHHHAYLQEIRVDKACEFLLADAAFIKWYHGVDSQQLAILGDMGSGKSIAMSFLIDELRRRNEHELPQPKICYHYCQNDGTGQPIYVFSVLILSLLEQLPGLKKTFFEWYKRTMASGTEPATNFKTLEEWLQNTLATLDRPLIFVIDGLDECDRLSRNRLVKSMRNMTENAPRLKILLSSRPEEEILEQLNGLDKIAMGSDPARDRLIVERTVETRLCYLSDDVKELVIHILSRSAQGSPIWTRMIVEVIEVRAIKAIGPMRAFLKRIPQPRQLSELYANLFSRYTSDDPENQRLASTALGILAVTRRPLSILELAWAVALGASHDTASTVDALADLVDHQRIMSLIQPFVAHVDFGDMTKRQVKLAHQSVKEFIIASWAPDWSSKPSLVTSTPPPALETVAQQHTQSLEGHLLATCIRYLLLPEINQINLFSEERLAIEELPQDPELFKENREPNDYDHYCSWEVWEASMVHYDPTERGFGGLFVYASCHWIEHFSIVTSESHLPRLNDVELLCQAGSTRLHNWTAQNCRPDCAIKPRFEFDSALYDPLSIACLYGSEAIIQRILENSDLDGHAFLPRPLLGAADQIIKYGDLPRLRLLWASRAGHQLYTMDFFQSVLRQWSRSPSEKRRGGWEMVFSFLDDVYETMIKERWGHTLLRLAATTGCMPMIRRLMEAAQHQPQLRAELLEVSQSDHGLIGAAVLGNHADVVGYLLEQRGIEAHLQCRNASGENVLHLASRHCNPAIFQQLVPLLKDSLYQKDQQGDTALIRIVVSSSASQNRWESARILLSGLAACGADKGECLLSEQQEALRIATRLGDSEMCRLFDHASP